MSRIRLMHSPSSLSCESNIHFYEKTLEKNVQERTLCHASFFLRILCCNFYGEEMLPAASSLDLLMQFPEVVRHCQKHRFHKYIGIASTKETPESHVRLDVGENSFRLDASIDSQPYAFL